jgi:hypothetical protein
MIDMARPTVEPIQRFITKVKITNNCWQWVGSVGGGESGGNYGQLWIDGANYPAHKFIYEYVHNKKLTPGILVCHTCDNSICVNPNHLFEGTHKDNMTDRNNKNRQAKGEGNGNHTLTEADVIEIRSNKMGVMATAKKFGIHRSTVNRLRKGLSWQHLK